MSSYKLTYFNFRARAEVIRMLFHLAGVDYVDERIDRAEWDKNVDKYRKNISKTGQLPKLTANGQVLYQSYAIGRYLANQFGLAGKNDWEKARADMVVYLAEDMVRPLIPAIRREPDPEKRNAMRRDYEANQLPTFLDNFEKLLAESKGDFFVGNEMTWADLTVMHTVQWFENKAIAVTFPWDKYPNVKAFLSRMEKSPALAEYLEKRPPSDL